MEPQVKESHFDVRLKKHHLGIDLRKAYESTPIRDLCEKTAAILLLLALSPFLLFCALIVKATSKGPIIYSQIRVGQNGRLFSVYKFRTMIPNAEADTGAVLSWDGDPRITMTGAIFRKLYLDELPQLYNVWRGDMSFIGPRPERPQFVDQYVHKIPGYGYRHYVKPGITGPAQITAGYHAKPAEKLLYDLGYIRNRDSIWYQFKIVVSTIIKIVNINNVEWLGSEILGPEAQQSSQW